MKYYIISGEPSGDLHGSNLMKAILMRDPEAKFRFWGGDQMLSVDNNLVTHIRETSIMGFVEVVKNLSKIQSFFKKARKTILDFRPDVLILIDYPGFNLRMAKWAKKKGFKTVFYISPQLWAWKKGRIKTIKKYVDEMIVILPFEVDFYKENGVDVTYVGHPLVPEVKSFQIENQKRILSDDGEKVLAILPGSREQEIRKILPIMFSAALQLRKEYKLCIAVAPNLEKSFYESLIDTQKAEIEYIENGTYHLLSKADLALVTSGTATLETALFQVPQVVCYKTNVLNYQIGKRLVDLQFISLVNLISGKEVIPELIQDEVNRDQIVDALRAVEYNSKTIQQDYKRLIDLLSIEETPHTKAAEIVVTIARS